VNKDFDAERSAPVMGQGTSVVWANGETQDHELASAIREAGETIAEAIKVGSLSVAKAICDNEGKIG
jgi:hypothetical protein